MKDSDYITAADLARKWDVSPQWVSKLVRQKRIKSKLLYGRRLILANTKRPEPRKPGPTPAAD